MLPIATVEFMNIHDWQHGRTPTLLELTHYKIHETKIVPNRQYIMLFSFYIFSLYHTLIHLMQFDHWTLFHWIGKTILGPRSFVLLSNILKHRFIFCIFLLLSFEWRQLHPTPLQWTVFIKQRNTDRRSCISWNDKVVTLTKLYVYLA